MFTDDNPDFDFVVYDFICCLGPLIVLEQRNASRRQKVIVYL